MHVCGDCTHGWWQRNIGNINGVIKKNSKMNAECVGLVPNVSGCVCPSVSHGSRCHGLSLLAGCDLIGQFPVVESPHGCVVGVTALVRCVLIDLLQSPLEKCCCTWCWGLLVWKGLIYQWSECQVEGLVQYTGWGGLWLSWQPNGDKTHSQHAIILLPMYSTHFLYCDSYNQLLSLL